ncbi:dehydrogenase [Actinoplanes sp. ATCC 53533]|uniref:zinc-dependent alcohol dehydrogenase n=1 Tax=Actinoplanes sp. ATCC 53533 TaxID=1288362 RepID=UPI000F7A41F7|nr:alcohol dehydrogenase catalytic domain-containing protein [Actinoplanes sp. ATCC 53533]RSM54910.1 dehydrogenase [Actinoplanes sp. ATCC 53533]
MPALVWHGGSSIAVDQVARPDQRSGRALLDVAYAGICGTDLHICAGEHPRARPGLVLGHEIVGRLAEPSGDLAAGAPVFVNPLLSCGVCPPCGRGLAHICDRLGLVGIDGPGGIAGQVSVPVAGLVPLPAEVDLRRAAMIEPFAVGVRAVRRSGLRLGEAVHVIGAGPIGLVVAMCARQAGAGRITVGEPVARRARTAADLGFEVIDADAAARVAPVVFDCTGHPSVAPGVTRFVATGGTLVTTGVYPGVVGVDLQDVLFRELTVLGTRVYTPDDVAVAVSLVTGGAIDPDPLVTAVVPLREAVGAVTRLRAGTELKVLIAGGAE